MIDVVNFIIGSSIVATILIGLIKKFIKESVEPRFSDLVVQIILLAISAIIAFIGYLINFIPKGIWSVAEVTFGVAIVIYQVLYKAIWNKAILNKLDADEK